MNTSTIEVQIPEAEIVAVSEDTLSVDLSDGRTIAVPLAWYPRLVYATQGERNNWELIGQGHGIRWPDLDEDISVEATDSRPPIGRKPAVFQALAGSKTRRPQRDAVQYAT